jgi:septal ring factor EnvC (AmiA/AmiB activator)
MGLFVDESNGWFLARPYLLVTVLSLTVCAPRLGAKEPPCQDLDCLNRRISEVGQRALNCKNSLAEARNQLTIATEEVSSTKQQLATLAAELKDARERLVETENKPTEEVGQASASGAVISSRLRVVRGPRPAQPGSLISSGVVLIDDVFLESLSGNFLCT